MQQTLSHYTGDESRRRRTRIVASCSALFAGTAIFFLFDPTHWRFYPVCLFHQLTGWYCPGCGACRAIHYLLHGKIEQAFHCNPLFVSVAPFAAGWAIFSLFRARPAASGSAPTRTGRWLWLLLLVVLTFGLVRNLPFAGLNWMRP